METLERGSTAAIDPAEAVQGRVGPAAWIGSIEDFEAAQAFGQWVDLTRTARDIMTDIRAIIDRSPSSLATRWDICATSGMGGWAPAENEGLPTVLNVAAGVLRFGEQYGGLAAAVGADSPALGHERFKLSYLGSWSSPRDFVEEIAREFGWYDRVNELPRTMRPYVSINYAAMARDARRELTFVDHTNGVWVYDPRVW